MSLLAESSSDEEGSGGEQERLTPRSDGSAAQSRESRAEGLTPRTAGATTPRSPRSRTSSAAYSHSGDSDGDHEGSSLPSSRRSSSFVGTDQAPAGHQNRRRHPHHVPAERQQQLHRRRASSPERLMHTLVGTDRPSSAHTGNTSGRGSAASMGDALAVSDDEASDEGPVVEVAPSGLAPTPEPENNVWENAYRLLHQDAPSGGEEEEGDDGAAAAEARAGDGDTEGDDAATAAPSEAPSVPFWNREVSTAGSFDESSDEDEYLRDELREAQRIATAEASSPGAGRARLLRATSSKSLLKAVDDPAVLSFKFSTGLLVGPGADDAASDGDDGGGDGDATDAVGSDNEVAMQVESESEQEEQEDAAAEEHAGDASDGKGDDGERRGRAASQVSDRPMFPRRPVGTFWGQKNTRASTLPPVLPATEHHMVLRTLIASVRSQLVPDPSVPTIFQPPQGRVANRFYPDSVLSEHPQYFWDAKVKLLADIDKKFARTYMRDAHLKVDVKYPFDRDISRKPALPKPSKKNMDDPTTQESWAKLHEIADKQRRERCEHVLHLLHEEQLRDMQREHDLLTCDISQRKATEERVIRERSEAADWLMRIMEDYNIVSSLTAGEYLHDTIKNSLKPEDDIASRRRANRERLEEELDELRTFKRIPAGELNASVPKTGWTTGYLAGEFGPKQLKEATKLRWNASLPDNKQPDAPEFLKHTAAMRQPPSKAKGRTKRARRGQRSRTRTRTRAGGATNPYATGPRGASSASSTRRQRRRPPPRSGRSRQQPAGRDVVTAPARTSPLARTDSGVTAATYGGAGRGMNAPSAAQRRDSGGSSNSRDVELSPAKAMRTPATTWGPAAAGTPFTPQGDAAGAGAGFGFETPPVKQPAYGGAGALEHHDGAASARSSASSASSSMWKGPRSVPMRSTQPRSRTQAAAQRSRERRQGNSAAHRLGHSSSVTAGIGFARSAATGGGGAQSRRRRGPAATLRAARRSATRSSTQKQHEKPGGRFGAFGTIDYSKIVDKAAVDNQERLEFEKTIPASSYTAYQICKENPRIRPPWRSEATLPDGAGNHHRDTWAKDGKPVMLMERLSSNAPIGKQRFSYLVGRRFLPPSSAKGVQ